MSYYINLVTTSCTWGILLGDPEVTEKSVLHFCVSVLGRLHNLQYRVSKKSNSYSNSLYKLSNYFLDIRYYNSDTLPNTDTHNKFG